MRSAGAARGAALGAIGGAIAGDAGKGAAIGAAFRGSPTAAYASGPSTSMSRQQYQQAGPAAAGTVQNSSVGELQPRLWRLHGCTRLRCRVIYVVPEPNRRRAEMMKRTQQCWRRRVDLVPLGRSGPKP